MSKILRFLRVLPMALLAFMLLACNSVGTDLPDGTAQPIPTEAPYRISFDFSPVPDLVNPGELTVTFDVNVRNLSQDLRNARMELEFYWTNTQGSYSEAKRSEPCPLKKYW